MLQRAGDRSGPEWRPLFTGCRQLNMSAIWAVSQPMRLTMDASNPSSSSAGPARPAWNKGKLTEATVAIGSCVVHSSQIATGTPYGDLALFNLAIDSKLRGCDLVALRVHDVAPNGNAIDRATVRAVPTCPRGGSRVMSTNMPGMSRRKMKTKVFLKSRDQRKRMEMRFASAAIRRLLEMATRWV